MMPIKKTILAFTLISILISCDKKSNFLPSTKIDGFNDFVNPSRKNILLLSNNNLYFVKDEFTTPLKLQSVTGEKKEISLSPDASIASFQDVFSNTYLVSTKQVAQSEAISRLNGAKHLHWTNDGQIYGVFSNNNASFIRALSPAFNYPIPNFPVDHTKNESLNDAVITADSNIVISKHLEFEDDNGLVFSFDEIIIWLQDSSKFKKLDALTFDALGINKLQIDNEDNVIGYTSQKFNSNEYDVYLLKEGNNDFLDMPKLIGTNSRYVKSIKNHIHIGYLSKNKQIILENNLRFTGYPDSAIDDTLTFNNILSIQDFDIKVPEEELPLQENPF